MAQDKPPPSTSSIGDLTSGLTDTLKSTRSTPTESSKTSETGRPTPPPASGERKTRTPSGSPGAGAKQTGLEVVLTSPPELASDEVLEARLRQLLGELRVIGRARYDDFGYDEEVVGYRALEPVSAEAEAEARALVAAANAPADPAELERELGKVAVVTVSAKRDIDIAGWTVVMLEELEDFPSRSVLAALKAWRRQNKWLPTEAEIIEEVHYHSQKRRAMLKLEFLGDLS